MKHINDFLKNKDFKKEFQYKEPFVNPDDSETAKIVNRLFITFQSIFPAFRQAWPTEREFEQTKREWIKALNYARLTDIDTIKRGVNRFRVMASPFVPSPGQFIEMCHKDEDYGFPSIHVAWKEVKRQLGRENKEWSHQAIQHAYKETGTWDLKHLPEKEAMNIFTRNYEIACRMMKEGKEMEPIMQGLPERSQTTRQTEGVRNAALAKIKGMLS